MSSSKPLQ